MKHITILVVALFLTACTTIAPNFDSIEYQKVVDIRHLASSKDLVCASQVNAMTSSKAMYEHAKYLKMYAEYLPRNALTVEMLDEMINMTGEMHQAYLDRVPSKRYCERKLEIIEHNAITMQKIIGRKPNR